MTTILPIDRIRIDGGTQIRAAINQATVDDYAEILRADADAGFPPVVVIFDGIDYWLGDGFHRLDAHRQIGRTEIECEVREGTQRDAVLFAVGANALHGLPRSRHDKRNAVQTLLNDPQWSVWSDRELARLAKVGAPLVAAVRKESSESSGGSRVRTVKRGDTEYQMDTSNIRREPASKPTTASEPAAQDDAAEDASDLSAELQRVNEELVAQIKSLLADDTKAELHKSILMREHLQRQVSEEMRKNKRLEEQRDHYAKQLRRCGKAVGEEDLALIAPSVEAFVRARKRVPA